MGFGIDSAPMTLGRLRLATPVLWLRFPAREAGAPLGPEGCDPSAAGCQPAAGATGPAPGDGFSGPPASSL